MPISSVREAVEAVDELNARLTAGTALIGADPSDAELEALIAGMDGVRSDGRALLKDLSLLDEEALAVTEDGLVTILLWRWRRATRSALVELMGATRTVQDTASALVTGTDERVVVTRQGDTLQRIAQRELGDWREWPRLLAANPGIEPGELPSGTSLVIPEKR